MKLTQEEHDCQRRAYLRKTCGPRLQIFGRRIISEFGASQTARVRAGIDVLLNDSYPSPTMDHPCPGLFYMPDLPAIRFWDMDLLNPMEAFIQALKKLAGELKACDRQPKVDTSEEWRDYMKTKFDPDTEQVWGVNNHYVDGEWGDSSEVVKLYLKEHMHWISNEIIQSRLEGHSSIPKHVDDNNYKITLHLGLAVPKGDCGICVGGETRSWESGEVLAFSDSYVHNVWNNADVPREVLLLDVWRPDLSEVEIQVIKGLRQILSIGSSPLALQ